MNLTPITLRALTAEERQALEHLASSRTTQARYVERAGILLALAHGRRPSQVAQDFGVCRPTVYTWIHRFNEQGLNGLNDRPRSGRPQTYTAAQRAEVIAAALADPQSLELPFGCWTLDRLEAYLKEQKGIPMKRSRINEILLDEGLKWRHQEGWFGARVDPDFAEKRGSSKRSTPPRPRARSSSASTKWDHSRPRATPAKDSFAPRRRTRPTAATAPRAERSKRSTAAAGAKVTSSAPSAP